MASSILPHLAHLSVVAATIAVAFLCIGIGAWAGARRAETALLAGWGVAAVTTVAVGTLTPIGLSIVMGILGLAGGCGLLRIAVTVVRGSQFLNIATFGRVALLGLPWLACIAGMETTAWDDFSHWLPNLSYLCVYDHFPTLALPSESYHAAYPYALALPGFAVFRLFGLMPENVALSWNLIMTLAAGASIARVLRKRVVAGDPSSTTEWTCAAVGLLVAGLACPTFVAKIIFSNMADSATGGVLAILASILFDWVNAADDQRSRIRLAWTFALGSAVLLDLRQANGALFGLLAVGIILTGWRQRAGMRLAAGASLAVITLLPLSVLLLWDHYATAQIPGGQFAIMKLSQWRWDQLSEIVGSMARVMTAKIGLFALILTLAVRAILALRSSDRLAPADRAVAIVGASVAAGMIGFLGFTYLAANFATDEAVAAASFWRYMSETGPLAVLAGVAIVPLDWWRRLPPRPLMTGMVCVALITPLATFRMYRSDLNSPVPALRHIARGIDQTVPRVAPILLADLTGNGFATLVVYYQLALSPAAAGLPPRHVSRVVSTYGISPDEAAKINFASADYVWLTEGAAQMATLFGPVLGTGCSYLLQRDTLKPGPGKFAIVERWPIGRFKWSTYPVGWTDAVDPACH